MNVNYLKIALAAASAIPVMAEAAILDFSYGTPGEEYKVYGYNKKETYDIAIHLGPEMAGAKVMGFTVPLPVENTQVANMTGWLTSELKTEGKKNKADLGEVSATLDDWTLTASFGDGITVPANGIYVGYSFDVTSFDGPEDQYYYPKTPVACVEGNNPDGLYIHTSRTVLKWKSLAEQIGAVSPMVVRLEGDFYNDAAAISFSSKPYVEIGHDGTVAVTVTNHGSSEIKEIHYTYEAAGTPGEGSFKFETPVEASFGATGKATVNIPPFEKYGTYSLTVTVDRVNGTDNLDPMRSATTDFVVAPFVPVNRPLVEEYTGLWCGYCPAGYVALEELNEELGDKFVALSYHNSDAMEIMKSVQFPIAQFQNSIAFPESQVNRLISEYPDTETLRALWKEYSETFSPANIDVTAEWTDENHTAMRAIASVKFIESLENHNYRVAFALVADNLTNPRFVQQNNYVGDDFTGKWWDLFTQGESSVKGLVFNSILSATSDINGVPDTLPDKIEMGETYEPEYIFRMADVRNTSGQEFLNSDCRLRVVAYIVDSESKHVVNSNSSAALDGYISGLETAVADTASECEYYTLQGVRVEKPADGIFIKVEKLESGQTVSSKVRL